VCFRLLYYKGTVVDQKRMYTVTTIYINRKGKTCF